MELRPATKADVELLSYWDTKAHVMAATGADDVTDWSAEIGSDPQFEVLIAQDAGRPIGVVQIIDPQLERTHYWGDVAANLRAIDIWIGEEADLGRGLGTLMMGLALDRCFAASEVNAVLIDPLESNTRAHRFYERLGFTPVGPRVFGEDHCLVYRLERADWARRSGSSDQMSSA
jgi:aminoglycoside 6'-N-acetyltransferase